MAIDQPGWRACAPRIPGHGLGQQLVPEQQGPLAVHRRTLSRRPERIDPRHAADNPMAIFLGPLVDLRPDHRVLVGHAARERGVRTRGVASAAPSHPASYHRRSRSVCPESRGGPYPGRHPGPGDHRWLRRQRPAGRAQQRERQPAGRLAGQCFLPDGFPGGRGERERAGRDTDDAAGPDHRCGGARAESRASAARR